MLEIGTLVDNKYKILHEIGHGGMSVVYMAVNERANKTWAIKEVQKRGSVDFEAVRQELTAEIELLKRLRHPNLPSIVDVLVEEERFLIVMDYIEGNSLAQILREEGSIPQEYVIDWAKQLCSVLLYLHTLDPPIIYRDMKPGNIICKPDGTLILIDFGTAREFENRKRADTICLGTVGYAAPEQFGGLGQSDARTDIYGLGATMYHLLTGWNPARTPYEFRPIRQADASLSAGLEHIVEKCTRRNPEERYPSAAELMYALEHYEEWNRTYRKQQVRRLICFLVTVFFAVAFTMCGFACAHFAARQIQEQYVNLLDDAAKTTDYSRKLELYAECIQIQDKCAEKEAYLGMMQTMKEDDMVFTAGEARLLTGYIQKNRDILRKHVDNYITICFEMGKLYWYYFVEEDGTKNLAVRGKYAAEWFGDVLVYAGEEWEHLAMAKVYARIGMFYRDITMDVLEANDRGKYSALWKDVQILLEEVAQDEQESEIVRLELLAFLQNVIWQYAYKLKLDGVDEDSVRAVFSEVLQIASAIEATTDRTRDKKERLCGGSLEVWQVIGTVFSDAKEEGI